MKRILSVLLAFSFLILAGCYEAKQAFVLNADGSGKFTIDLVFQSVSFGGNKKDPEKALIGAVKDFLTKTKGVDAWKDVAFSTQDDGRIKIVATGYFPDLSKLELQQGNFLTCSLAPGEKGNLVFTVKGDSKKKAAKVDPPGPLTPEEKAKRIAKAKGEFQQGKGMLTAFLANLRHEASFALPGKLESSINMKKLDGGLLGVTLDGKKLLAAIEALGTNEAFFERQVLAPGADPFGDGAFNQGLYGEKGPVQAVLAKPFAAKFDYAAEVAAAKAAQETLYKTLGLVETVAAPAGAGQKAARIVGVQLAREVDDERGMSPFNMWKPGYGVSVLVSFGGAALSVDGAVVERAKTDDGQDLLPEEESDRTASFPRLLKDNSGVVCEFRLRLPKSGARSLADLGGKVIYQAASKTRQVDLAFAALKAGQKSKLHGAEIKEVKVSSWDKEKTEIEIAFALSASQIKEIQILDASGKALEAEKGSSSQSGESCEQTMRVTGKIPEKGKVILILWDDVKKYEVPFTASKATLLGEPLP